MRSWVSGRTVKVPGVGWGGGVGTEEAGSSLGKVVPGNSTGNVRESEGTKTPLQASEDRTSFFPLQDPVPLSGLLCLFNYNVSQAGTWPRATEWPLGKSSSIPTSGTFPSPRLPAPLILGNSTFRRVQQAPGKPRPPGAPRPQVCSIPERRGTERLHLPAATARRSAQA